MIEYKKQDGGTTMAVSYTKLWKLLLDKKMKRTDLKTVSGISSSTLAKLGKDKYVSLESIDKICCALNCNIGDIIDVTKVENQEVEDIYGKY